MIEKILYNFNLLRFIKLSAISQTEKDKYCIISLIRGVLKYNKLVNTTKRSRLRDIQNKLLLSSGGGSGI